MLRSQITSIVIYGKEPKGSELEIIGLAHKAESATLRRPRCAEGVWPSVGIVAVYPLGGCMGDALPRDDFARLSHLL